MKKDNNQKGKQIFLLGLLALLAVLVARQYLPKVQLPTNARIKEEEQRLQSRINDLMVQKKTNENLRSEAAALREKSTIFWIRTKMSLPVEQEVLEEFNNVARLASINIQSKEPRLIKNPNATYIQEVELRLDMRGITMREFTRLLKQLERNKRRFIWAVCRIEPDNLQKPTGIKVNARLKAYVLSEDGSMILANGMESSSVSGMTSGKAAASRSVKGGTSNRRQSSTRQNGSAKTTSSPVRRANTSPTKATTRNREGKK